MTSKKREAFSNRREKQNLKRKQAGKASQEFYRTMCACVPCVKQLDIVYGCPTCKTLNRSIFAVYASEQEVC